MTKSKRHKSALQEQDGVSDPGITDNDSITRIKNKRSGKPKAKSLIDGVLKGDITALSQAITLVESRNPDHAENARAIVKACLPKADNSIRIGVTGVPGVGKSTFIETLGKQLTGMGKKVAVLAVDPSSTLSKGSILGDKTRMEDLVKDSQAFIRPSASGDTMGGVARKTRETIILCEAAGFDTIIIETVGVGQSETAVHGMVDFFLLLKLAGAGDELQGIKRGIIEMADAIVINKADGDNMKRAKLAQVEFQRALHFYPAKGSDWTPQVLLCSAIQKTGVSEIWDMIESYVDLTGENGYFDLRRKDQNKYWLLQTIEDRLKSDFFMGAQIKKAFQEQLKLMESRKTTPFEAAEALLKLRD